MLHLLTFETLPVDQLLSSATPKVKEQGNALYRAGLARVEHSEPTSAIISVQDSSGPPAQCTVRLSDQYVTVTCSCQYGYAWGLCKHRVAALLTLREYLYKNPPSLWRAVLAQAIDQPSRKSGTSAGNALLFSLQQRINTWAIVPLSLSGKQLPLDHGGDADRIAEAIEEHNLKAMVKTLRNQISIDSYPSMPSETLAAANTALSAGGVYGYWYGGTKLLASLLSMLGRSLVYFGTEADPLQERLFVRQKTGTIELELARSNTDLSVQFTLVTDDRRLALKPGRAHVLSRDPMWMLIENMLIPIGDTPVSTDILVRYPQLQIPQRDETEFLERFLLPLAESMPVRGDLIDWMTIEADPQPLVYLSEHGNNLRAELRFGYGEFELPYEKQLPAASTRRRGDSTTLARIERKPAFEQEAWQNLSSFGLKRGDAPAEFMLRRGVAPIDFLLREVPKLAQAGYTIFGEEALTLARVNRNKPTISFAVSSGIDWFDLTTVVQFGDQEVALKDFKRAIRRRDRYVKLADGSIGMIPEEWMERYRHLFALADGSDEQLRLSNHHLALIDQVLGEADRAQSDAEFQARRERLRGFERIEPRDLPTGFQGVLRPYQKAAFDWMHFLRSYNFGGCLADDMGMGKSVVTLAFLQSIYEADPATAATLLVMPRSLIFNWEREAARFAPHLRVYVHADQGRIKHAEDFAQHDIALTTYGVMLRDIALLRDYRFHCAILDESQAIKNPLGETSRAARLLNAEHRFVLTGTPVENSALELWSQFAYLNPGLLGNLDYFREEFVTPIEKKQDADTAQFLRKMVYPFILRRTKDQVALDLPPRSEDLLVTEMEPAQRKLYVKTRDYYRALLLGMIEDEGFDDARMKILEGLLRLRQICNHPKLVEANFRGTSGKFELLIETLETLRSEGHKALVFSQFVQMLTMIREALDARKIPYAYLDGSTRKRKEEVDRFQSAADLPFFLISLKAGGVGLNLTAADYVIHVDPWWNPAVEMQATDRTHRIGQTKPVFVYKLITRDTVEEKILQLQDQKRALVAQLISAEGGLFKSLTRDDVEVLFT